ncbi:cellulose biosynthesis protein BcsG, partial [Proteus mirabilis]
VMWLNISGFTHFSGAMASAVSVNSFTQQTNTSIDQPQPQNTEILSTAQTRAPNNSVLSSPYPPQKQPANNKVLDEWLAQFDRYEHKRSTPAPAQLSSHAQP